MLKRIILTIALAVLPFSALCAPPLSNDNLPLLSIQPNFSGTIASTNTFQSIQGQTNNRQGCTIQNLGTHTQYVFFGPIASATTSNAVQLAAGWSVNCAVSGAAVLIDPVSITGTSGDAFYANFQ